MRTSIAFLCLLGLATAAEVKSSRKSRQIAHSIIFPTAQIHNVHDYTHQPHFITPALQHVQPSLQAIVPQYVAALLQPSAINIHHQAPNPQVYDQQSFAVQFPQQASSNYDFDQGNVNAPSGNSQLRASTNQQTPSLTVQPSQPSQAVNGPLGQQQSFSSIFPVPAFQPAPQNGSTSNNQQFTSTAYFSPRFFGLNPSNTQLSNNNQNNRNDASSNSQQAFPTPAPQQNVQQSSFGFSGTTNQGLGSASGNPTGQNQGYYTGVDQDGSYNFGFRATNGLQSEESGAMHPSGQYRFVQGSYSYTAPDGTPISAQYYADHSGFHVTGSHIPTPPPVPERNSNSLDDYSSRGTA